MHLCKGHAELAAHCGCWWLQERDTHDKIAKHSLQHWAPTSIHIVRTGPHIKRGKRVKGITVMYRDSPEERACSSCGKVCPHASCLGYAADCAELRAQRQAGCALRWLDSAPAACRML